MPVCVRLRLSSRLTCMLCGLMAVTAPSWAEDISRVQWHGFVSQGYIKTSDNNFYGDSEDGSWEFTDVGLGGSWRPAKNWQLSAQAIYRQAGETSQDGVNLDYALINYTALNQLNYGLGFRAGRIKNPYGFYNETRDVAFTRPSVLLPESIYQDALHELFHSSDSGSVYGYRQWGDLLLNIDLVYGTPNFDEQSENVLIPGPAPGGMDDERLLLSRTMFDYDAGRIRGGFSYGKMSSDIEFDSQLAVFGLYSGELDAHLRLWSLEYNWERWQLSSEYQRISLSYRDILGPNYRETNQSEAYYVQTAFQLSSHWRLLARYDVYYPDKDDKSGNQLAAKGQPKFEAYAKDFTLSARYDINASWMLAAEWHQVRGTAWLSSLENPESADLEKDWNLYSAQLSYRF